MQNKLVHIFYWVFAVCFTFVALNVIFANEYFKTTPLIITSIICLALLFMLYKLLDKCKNITDRQYKRILIIYAASMFIIQLVLGLLLRHDTWFDVGAIHKGAAEWVETGTFRSYYEYFCYFPNNLGAMVFVYMFLKAASMLGITDYYAVSAFVTSFMLSSMMVIVSLICRRLRDIKHGLFALILFAISVQYWFMGGAVYTDALSMLFPVLTFWLYLKSMGTTDKKKFILYVLMGISAAIGCLNKFTVFIVAIAIIIDMCLRKNFRDILRAAVCMVGITAISITCLNGYMYSKHMDRNMRDQIARPYIHWVMMGLKGSGAYNAEDYVFTDSISDPAEKRSRDRDEAIKRIKELGIPGMYKLIRVKSSMNYGDGTYGISDFLNIYPKTDTKLHDWVLYDGKHYNTYAVYATSMHIALMLIMIINAFVLALRKSDKEKELLVPYLAFFGVWLFLLCWETNRRYFSNFAPMMFICASVGMYSFNNAIYTAVRKFAGGKNAK